MTTERTIAWSAGTWSKTIVKRTAVAGRTTAESASVITSKRTTATNSASECTIIWATVAKTTVIVWTIHSIIIWTTIKRTSIHFLTI